MIRTDQRNNPVIALQIQDPYELSEQYYQVLNDDFKHYVTSVLEYQYHMDYHNCCLPYPEKVQRLSFLSNCLQEVEHGTQKIAMNAAGLSIEDNMYLGEGMLKNVQNAAAAAAAAAAKGAAAAGGALVKGGAAAVKGGSSVYSAATSKIQKQWRISKLESFIKTQLETLIKTFPTAVKNMEALKLTWDSIMKSMEQLSILKAS